MRVHLWKFIDAAGDEEVFSGDFFDNFFRILKEILFVPGKPETSTCKWFFQLDDSKSLHGTWLFKQTSIPNCLFGVQV